MKQDKSDEIRLQVVLQGVIDRYAEKHKISRNDACEDLGVRYEFYREIVTANDKHDARSNII